MSSFYDWAEIPAPIQESIALNTGEDGRSGCGCHERGDQWWLCQYHIGMIDGWEAHEESVPAPSAVTEPPEDEWEPKPARFKAAKFVQAGPAPAVTSEPPRTEWVMWCYERTGVTRIADPDWVLVRPCDLRPGDRIAWGDGDAEITVGVTPDDDGQIRIETVDEGTWHWLPAWSPVLVRREGQ